MDKLQSWLMVTFISIILMKMVWEYIQGLKTPTNDEVRDIARIEGRINTIESRQNRLEHTINQKVDNAVWLERSEKIEAFSKQHNLELTEVRREIRSMREELIKRRD